jgi:hypothetical protein
VTCSNSELLLKLCLRHLVRPLGRGISLSQGLYLHRKPQHKNTRTNIYALSWFWTHDLCVQATKALPQTARPARPFPEFSGNLLHNWSWEIWGSDTQWVCLLEGTDSRYEGCWTYLLEWAVDGGLSARTGSSSGRRSRLSSPALALASLSEHDPPARKSSPGGTQKWRTNHRAGRGGHRRYYEWQSRRIFGRQFNSRVHEGGEGLFQEKLFPSAP